MDNLREIQCLRRAAINYSDMLAARAELVWKVNSSRNAMIVSTGGGNSSGNTLSEASCDKNIPICWWLARGLYRR